jgi:hypothetical protein
MDSAVGTLMWLYLFYMDRHVGLGYEMDMINIEAEFLEGDMDKSTFIEWPAGMLELGFTTEEEFNESCIQLLKSMYRNMDVAVKLFKTNKLHLLTA